MICKPGNILGSGGEENFTWEQNSGIQRVGASETRELRNQRPPWSSPSTHSPHWSSSSPSANLWSHTRTHINVYLHTPKELKTTPRDKDVKGMIKHMKSHKQTDNLAPLFEGYIHYQAEKKKKTIPLQEEWGKYSKYSFLQDFPGLGDWRRAEVTTCNSHSDPHN